MLKYAALLFNTIALLIYQFFFADGITVTQNAPSSAKADTEFTVEIAINKGSIGGFAKLQQDLPEGFTAIQDENNGASFTFSNQSVKFIWMSLPNDKDFKIKYKVKVAAGIANGDKVIGGKFSYVTDNVKQQIDIAPATIKVTGGVGASEPVAENTTNTTTTPTTTGNTSNTTATTPTTTGNTSNTTASTPTTTDNTSNTTASTPATTTPATTPTTTGTENTTATSTTPSSSAEPSSIVCTRKAPENVSGDFTVELSINKGNVSGFAKLLETLPAGFTATAGESQGASFSFMEGKVKFVWVSMPATPEFKVTYKVSVAPGTTGNQIIDGVFSYIENDETKKYTIPTTTIAFGGASQPVATTTTPATTTTTATTTNSPATTTTTPTTDNSNSTVTATTPTATTTSPATTSTTTTTSSTTDNSATALSATNIPAAQGNVNYKVQIAALRNAVDADKLASRFNIPQRVETEMANGLTKYVVGSHTEYKSARDAREEIKTKGAGDAFVTAYNSGKRITVQEALMITTQKWYR